MQTLITKLAATASIAALICATPVSIDLIRSGAGDASGATRMALTFDSAQAHAAREHGGGHQAAGHGGDRQVAGRGENRSADHARADNGRAWDGRADSARADNIRANNVKVNNAKVNNVDVNNVGATRIGGTYVRPPYVAPRAAAVAAGTAVAVGTTVAALPASCTIVVYDGVTYHDCGGSYYVASNGAYVVVNPPR